MKSIEDEKERENRAYRKAEWNAIAPLMYAGFLKFKSFEEYYADATGKNVDLRPTDDILSEVEKIKEEFA